MTQEVSAVDAVSSALPAPLPVPVPVTAADQAGAATPGPIATVEDESFEPIRTDVEIDSEELRRLQALNTTLAAQSKRFDADGNRVRREKKLNPKNKKVARKLAKLQPRTAVAAPLIIKGSTTTLPTTPSSASTPVQTPASATSSTTPAATTPKSTTPTTPSPLALNQAMFGDTRIARPMSKKDVKADKKRNTMASNPRAMSAGLGKNKSAAKNVKELKALDEAVAQGKMTKAEAEIKGQTLVSTMTKTLFDKNKRENIVSDAMRVPDQNRMDVASYIQSALQPKPQTVSIPMPTQPIRPLAPTSPVNTVSPVHASAPIITANQTAPVKPDEVTTLARHAIIETGHLLGNPNPEADATRRAEQARLHLNSLTRDESYKKLSEMAQIVDDFTRRRDQVSAAEHTQIVATLQSRILGQPQVSCSSTNATTL